MTEAQYLALAARDADEAFAFHRRRGGASVRFLPSSPRLHFASRDTDTLSVVVPAGFLAAGDSVSAEFCGTTVFVGEVDTIVKQTGAGSDGADQVTCCGPWAKMSRLVYRQHWRGASGPFLSSRLILNQDSSTGAAQDLDSELYEIAHHGASACGYTVAQADVSVSTQELPFDECRDITIADAIRRELRLFPRTVTRFDYNGQTPKLIIERASTNDAAYIDPKMEREKTYTSHPITGVYLEIETVAEGYRAISNQSAGVATPGNPDCLYATLQIAGASANAVTQSFESITEDLPSSLNDKSWWMQKHPRLNGVAASQLTITDGARSGESDKADYPRISACQNIGDLKEAGCRARVEQFTCKATIARTDYQEEEIFLTMNFVTTDAIGTQAEPHTYRWTVEASATGGESVPEGLAEAILADRSGTLRGERLTMRLKDDWPTIGDAIDGLILQSVDVDCDLAVATLSFGAPDYLTPEDMASLLSGFRNKRPSTCSASRISGKPKDDNKDEVAMGGIPPLSSTEFAPGTTAKQTFTSPASGSSASSIVVDATGSTGGNVEIKTADVGAGKTLKARELKWTDANGTQQTVKILATGDATIPQGGSEVDLDGKSIEKVPDAEAGATPTGDEGKIQIKGFNHAYDGKAPYKKNNELVWDGKTILNVQVTPIGGYPGGVKTTITYSDGSSTEINLSNGLRGNDGAPGQDGETPEITAHKSGEVTNIYSDGVLIAGIRDGRSPNITATKDGGVTTIFSDGVPIAQIADGAGTDQLPDRDFMSGLSFAISNGKLVATLTKENLKTGATSTSTANVCVVGELDVVVSEGYSTSTHQFTNTRKRIKTIGSPVNANGQTPFTATPLSGE